MSIDMAFADGGVAGPNPSEVGGTWAWVHVSGGVAVREASGGVRPADVGLPRITNNLTELLACVLCLEALPDGWDGVLHTDSNVTRCRLVNDDPGMAGIPEPLQARVWDARLRLGRFRVVLLDGHPTQAQLASGVGKRGNPCSAFNVRCDKLCGEQSRKLLAAARPRGAFA
jgi:hypothetical protein